MALANQRDGGYVIIGVSDRDPLGPDSGMTVENQAAWLDHDATLSRINAYADPPLSIVVEPRQLIDGRPVIVLQVDEFASIPVLCSRDYGDKLVKGELYTRSLAKPESSRAITQNELRAVLDLATQKQLRHFIEMSRHAGIDIGLPSSPSDVEHFIEQAESAAAITGSANLGPRFEFEIWPSDYDPNRINYAELETSIEMAAVRGFGWSLPYSTEVGTRGDDWVAGDTQVRGDDTRWFIAQSGLIFIASALPGGFGPDAGGIGDTETARGFLPVWHCAAMITLGCELAARAQLALFPDASVHLRVKLVDASGWQLVVANARSAGFHGAYQLSSDLWFRDNVLTPEQALTGTRQVAAELTTDLLLRFGWRGVTNELVSRMQNDTIGELP